jgi:hypothetical protein
MLVSSPVFSSDPVLHIGNAVTAYHNPECICFYFASITDLPGRKLTSADEDTTFPKEVT